jgi:hypothetical protein
VERARVAAAAVLYTILAFATVALASIAPATRLVAAPAAVVGWPPSTLVLSEVQTGGASASDEFFELANAGPVDIDLGGLEIAYVTSTGGTVTRKATWATGTVVAPGRHLLIANTSGAYAGIADATYSGGLAATGGALVLRVVGGGPIDAVGWGDASNGFVEGNAALAPSAGQSIERLPGGMAGNGVDTNVNGDDWFVQTTPNPQAIAAPPVPVPGATPSPAGSEPATPEPPTAAPTPLPSAATSPVPTTPEPSGAASTPPSAPPAPTPDASMPADESASPAAPSPPPLPTPTPTPTPVPTVAPTAPPVPTPSAAVPTPSPSSDASPPPTMAPTAAPDPSSSPVPTSTPQPSALPIALARDLATGAPTVVEGVLTMDLPSLESGRVGFVQDGTAGIAVYLDAVPSAALPAGTVVRLPGTIDERYAARTLRVGLADVETIGFSELPAALSVATGAVDELVEGRRVTVDGTTIGSPTTYADGLGILVDDGSGAVRVIVGPNALGSESIPSGTLVSVSGPVGQRDSTGTGLGGYRIHATLPLELAIVPKPAPSPSPTAAPSTAPSAPPTGTPTPTSSPAPGPSPVGTAVPGLTIGEARERPVGSVVTITGTVTAEKGRLGIPPVIVIADASGGLPVRLPDGVVAPERGRLVRVTGHTADPYGQLEIRPTAGDIAVLGYGALPAPLAIAAAQLGEGTEGRLVSLVGTQLGSARRSPTGDITIDVTDPSGTTVRVEADASSGIGVADLAAGAGRRFIGVVGQRASRRGSLDGYRIWLRDRADLGAALFPSGPGSTSSPGTSPSPGSSAEAMPIAGAARLDGATVVVEGIVTAGPGLIDSAGRLIVIQDATGGIEVLVPVDAIAPAAGTRIRVGGAVGRAYGATRIKANTLDVLATNAQVTALQLAGAPGEGQEWRLVRIAGVVTDVTRLGDKWHADVRVGAASVLVSGVAGSGIPSTMLAEGRSVTVTGIVRRPYPTATDRRWAVMPRGTWDVAVSPPHGGAAAASGAGTATGAGPGAASSATAYELGGRDGTASDVDLAVLAEHLGQLVRVGGLITAVAADGFVVDDGTATVRVVLGGEAGSFAALVHVGDAIGLVGLVEEGPDDIRIAVDDPAGVVRLGSLGEIVPIAAVLTAAPAADPGSMGQSMTASPPMGGSLSAWLLGTGALAAGGVSLAAAILRRRRARRRLVAAVLRRIGVLARPAGSPEPVRAAESTAQPARDAA